MKKTILPGLCLILAASWLFQGCKSDKEGQAAGSKPVISVLSQSVPSETAEVCEEESDNVLFLQTGTTLTLELKFTGSSNLSQYKLDVHDAFDCHEHKSTATPWSLSKIRDLQGTEATVTEQLTVPADAAAGNYHLMIRAVDISGRESEEMEFILVITNTDDIQKPDIHRNTPSADSVVMSAGSLLEIAAHVSDDKNLYGGSYEIHWKDAAGAERELLHQDFPNNTFNQFNIHYEFPIPLNAVKGWSVFEIHARDAVNNPAVDTFYVDIQ